MAITSKAPKPVLWIVAGPNGSGKSSLYAKSEIEGFDGSVWIINPDLLTAKIIKQERLPIDEANLTAVQRIEKWLNASIEAYQTIGVETVLSTPKYRDLVERAKERGFEVRMIYVLLASAEIQAKRIAIRVSEGGHNVPPDKIIARRTRSFEQLAWFLGAVDICWIFDNSIGEPKLIGVAENKALVQLGRIPDDLMSQLLAAKVKIVLPKH